MAAHGRIDLSAARLQAMTVDQKRMNVRHSSKVRPAKKSPNKTSPNKRLAKKSSPKRSLPARPSPKPGKGSRRASISSSSPLGMMALHLLAQWKQSGGLVFLAESENRAERLGSVIHALDPSCEVLVFPRLNTLPFDQL